MRGADASAALAFLRGVQRRQRIQTCAAIIGGGALSLIGPLFVELFFLFGSTLLISQHGFWGAYWIIAGFSLPIFFFVAFMLRGSVLEKMVPDGDSLSGRFMQRKVAPALVILEIANVGPRLVIWGLGRIVGERRVHGASLARIAKCLVILSATDGGISPSKLTLPGENVDQLASMLGFLLFYGLIDLSSRGDRVWLTSLTRTKLQKPLER